MLQSRISVDVLCSMFLFNPARAFDPFCQIHANMLHTRLPLLRGLGMSNQAHHHTRVPLCEPQALGPLANTVVDLHAAEAKRGQISAKVMQLRLVSTQST